MTELRSVLVSLLLVAGSLLSPVAALAQGGLDTQPRICGGDIKEGCSFACRGAKDGRPLPCPELPPPPGACPPPPGCDPTNPVTIDACRVMTSCRCTNMPEMELSPDGTVCQPSRTKPGCNSTGVPNSIGVNDATCIRWDIFPKKSRDPNVKVGTVGVADPGFVRAGTPLNYAIFFENLPAATGAAQVVVVTDRLDVDRLDLDTFELGPIVFGGVRVLAPPPGVQSYAGGIDLRPAQDLIVTVDAALDRDTGVVTWTLTSIDPATGQLTDDPDAGFLPPNAAPPAGEGVVAFRVTPKAGLATGTAVANQASIVFDLNAAIDTPAWSNAVDDTKPTSGVSPLAATRSSPTFDVSWSGADVGSGVANYTVYVSDDGAPFAPWLERTPASSGTFAGQMGHTYRFLSIAEDRVGNVEPPKTLVEATTQVVPVALLGALSRKVQGAAGTFDLVLSLAADDPTVEPRSGGGGGDHTIVLRFDQPVSAGDAAVTAGTGIAGTPTFAGNDMVVPLSGIANQQYVTLSVSNVVATGGSGGFGSVRVGFLLGDVNQNRVVTVADLGQVNAQIAQVVTAANYLKDVNASGTLTVADKGIANTQITRALPAP
jgi:hypothetical protein